MAYIVDAETCCGCATCVDECPQTAISIADDGKCVINADECIDCGACAGVCPFDAIAAE